MISRPKDTISRLYKKNFRFNIGNRRIVSWPFVVLAFLIFGLSLVGDWYLWRFVRLNILYFTAERLSIFVLVVGAIFSVLLFRVLYAMAVSRKEAERLRAEAEAVLLAVVLRSANDAIIVQDLEGRIIAWNRGAEQIYEYPESAALDMNIERLVPEARRGELEVLHDRLEQTGIVSSFETKRATRSGRIIDVWLTATMLRDAKNNPFAIAITERDITERKKLTDKLETQTKELERSNRNLEKEKAQDEALLTNIGEGIAATDSAGVVIFLNSAAESMLGITSASVVGRPIFEALTLQDDNRRVIPKEKQPAFLALVRGERVVTTITGSNYCFVRNDKTVFPVALTATPVIIRGGIIGSILVFRDITKEKEIDKAKSEFVSLASHQLRTPLSTIRWYVETVLAERVGRLNKEQRGYLRIVYDGGKRMIDLVNALLNVSRIELGTFVIDPKPTDIVEVAESVFTELMPVIEEKHLEVIKDYDRSIVKMNVDPELTRIVFQNLLTNAVKYTPESGLIKMVIKKQEEDILISVTDTGYGIPRAEQEQIFSKLYRATNAREHETDGNGLGLYIVKSILDHSGGRVWFKSPVEVVSPELTKEPKAAHPGTAFYVTIPLKGMESKEGIRRLK